MFPFNPVYWASYGAAGRSVSRSVEDITLGGAYALGTAKGQASSAIGGAGSIVKWGAIGLLGLGALLVFSKIVGGK